MSETIVRDRYSFAAFKAGPGGRMFDRLGFGAFIEGAASWRMLRSLIVHYNDNKERGAFVDAAKQLDGVASSGERVLLHAILFAMDFAWLADEMDAGKSWRRMDGVSGAHCDAVVACILQDAAR